MKTLSGPAAFSLICWIFALLLSFMWAPEHETSLFALSIIFLSFSFFGMMAACAREGEISWPRSWLVPVGFAFWTLAGASIAWSAAKFESFLYFWFLSALPISFLVFTISPARESFFKSAAAAGGLLMALLSVSCLVQYLFIPDFLFHGRVQWPMQDPNALAGVLSFGVFGFTGWMLAAQNRIHSNAALVLCVLALAALMTTGSRSAFIALLAGFALLLMLAPGVTAKHKKCLGALLAAGAVLFFALGLVAPNPQTAPAAILTGTLSGDMPGLWTRPYIWASTWQMTGDHFWLGTGIGTFPLYYPEYRVLGDFRSSGAHAHSDPLQFWAEMGVMAPILFYLFIVIGLARTISATRGMGRDNIKRIFIVVPFCALGAMAVQAHVTSLFHALPVLIVAGAAMAFWLRESGDGMRMLSTEKAPYTVMMTALAAALVFLGVFTSFAASEVLVARAKNAALAGDIGEYASAVNRADAVSLKMNPRPFVMAASVPVGILEAQDMLKGDQNLLAAQAEVLLAQARARNPRIAEIPFLEARIAQAERRGTDALYFLRETVRLDPLYLEARMRLYAALTKEKEFDEAYKILKGGVEWPYRADVDTTGYYLQLAAIAASRGDRETQVRANDLLKRAGERMSAP